MTIQSVICMALVIVAWLGHAQPLFEEVWTVESVNGVLNVFLVDELSNVTIDGKTVELRVWNKSFTGPLLKARRGDVVNIYLQNLLDQDTNLHFHGFHISPQIPADDATFALGNNNKVKLYTFTIPQTHPQGLYWYHSHAMPNTEYQIFNGMSGPFVIDGLLDPLPQLANVKEKMILLRDMQIVNGSVPDQADYVGEGPTTRLVNNNVFPTLKCPQNETQLWSFANLGADIAYDLALEDSNGKASTDIQMWLIAVDGVLYNQKVQITESFILGPANRAQFLVQCPGSTPATDIKLVSRNFSNGIDQFPYTDLMRVEVKGIPSNQIDISNLTFPAHQDYRKSNITAERTIVFSESDGTVADGGSDEGSFFINNRPFSMNRVDIRTSLGSIERWKIVNVSPEAHYFHIHQGHFQVVSVDGVPVPFYGYTDTVFVAQPKTPGGNVTVEVIMPFTNKDQVGKFRYHCHIESHADGGMMATIEVMDSPQLDVVFIAVTIPVLFIILIVSALTLGYQWYVDRNVVVTTSDVDSDDDPKKSGSENETPATVRKDVTIV